MKKVICCAVLVAIAFLLASPLSSHAGGSRVHFGVNVGVGHGYWGHGYWGPRYWGPRYWGPRVWWGPSVWWGAPYYYSAPPVSVQQPPVYEQPAPPPEEPQYWYYCQNPQGYYPYIQQCPNGWMKVVPPATPPGQ
jgi:hypothetical protein